MSPRRDADQEPPLATAYANQITAHPRQHVELELEKGALPVFVERTVPAWPRGMVQQLHGDDHQHRV